MVDKGELISELRKRAANLEPLPDEPDFATAEETLVRYLKARDWNLTEAERQLIDTVEYRRRTRPLRVDCSWCHKRPGFHSMRQVGHDEAGRPVIYANFAQASTHRTTAEDTLSHVIYLIENAQRSMPPGVSTWVFVMDCTGMTLTSCNPKLAHTVMNVLSNHYPERLGLAVCLNHSGVFHGVWKAIRKFLPPQTVAKMKFVRSKAKAADLFSAYFSPELSAWLQDEIARNKQKPLPPSQLEFWNPPQAGDSHDPRGCPSYVRRYLTPLHLPHLPHPNIADSLRGLEVRACSLTPEELKEREHAQRTADADVRAAGDSDDELLRGGEDNDEAGGASGDELEFRSGSGTDMPAPGLRVNAAS